MKREKGFDKKLKQDSNSCSAFISILLELSHSGMTTGSKQDLKVP